MPLELEVTLSGPLSQMTSRGASNGLVTTRVEERAARVAAALGLSVDVHVTVVTSAADALPNAPLSLRVDGAPCRFPGLLPALADSALHRTWPDATDPDAWIAATFSPDAHAEVVAAACEQALVLNPALLVSEEASRTFTAQLVAHDRALASWFADAEVNPASMRTIMRNVVGLRISLADTRRVVSLLRDGEPGTTDQLSEVLIGGLASDTVGILVPDAVGQLLGRLDFEDPDDLLAFVAEGLTEETGIVMPRLVVEPDQGLPEGTFAIRINDLMTLPTMLVPADTILVNETADRLALITEVTATMINPATGRPAALARASAAQELEAQGFTTWTAAGHVCLQLASELRRHVAALVSQDRVLAQIDVLEDSYPLLVRSARAELQPAKLTQLVRRLASDHVSLRHLPLLLERVVDLPIDALGPQRYALLADAVSTPTGLPQPPPREFDRVEAFVRAGLRHEVAPQARRGEVMVVYLIAPELEASLLAVERSEADEERVLAAIRDELGHLPAAALVPSILTATYARAPLRDLLRASFPTMIVLAHDDLPPEMAVQPIARIASTD